MSDKKTVLREIVYPVQGTTKLNLYDSGYDQGGTDYEFFGHISAAPLGLLRIREVQVECEPGEYCPNGLKFNEFDVSIFQAKFEEALKTYSEDKYYPKAVKKEYDLNCETASFVCETKFGSHNFYTGADGFYASLTQMKQYYGMILDFSFNDIIYTFEELENIFLKLWKKRTVTAA